MVGKCRVDRGEKWGLMPCRKKKLVLRVGRSMTMMKNNKGFVNFGEGRLGFPIFIDEYEYWLLKLRV